MRLFYATFAAQLLNCSFELIYHIFYSHGRSVLIPFLVVAHSASTKKVSAEQHLFINWSPPERLEELKESAKTFYDTDYNVTGYRVLAKLDSSSGSSSRPSQSGGSGSDSSAIVAVIDTNTTYDLTVLFPSFNNQFDNVSFQVHITAFLSLLFLLFIYVHVQDQRLIRQDLRYPTIKAKTFELNRTSFKLNATVLTLVKSNLATQSWWKTFSCF